MAVKYKQYVSHLSILYSFCSDKMKILKSFYDVSSWGMTPLMKQISECQCIMQTEIYISVLKTGI